MTKPVSLEEILSRGEGQRIEFKRRLPGREERVAHLLAALANAGGGTIAVGVDDDGKAVGLLRASEVALTVQDIARTRLDPSPSLSTRTVSSDAGEILLIRVEPGGAAPVRPALAAGGATYLRVNDRNVPLEGGRRALAAAAAHGGKPVGDRLATLEPRVRTRLERVLQHSARFTAVEYAARCNVSIRTARRDIRRLAAAFLAVEVAPGVYEVPGD